jgi:hypothetical protein
MTQIGHDPSLGQRPGSLTHNTSNGTVTQTEQVHNFYCSDVFITRLVITYSSLSLTLTFAFLFFFYL